MEELFVPRNVQVTKKNQNKKHLILLENEISKFV